MAIESSEMISAPSRWASAMPTRRFADGGGAGEKPAIVKGVGHSSDRRDRTVDGFMRRCRLRLGDWQT